MTLRDVLTALLVVTLLGVNFVAIKVGLETLPPLLLTALRFLLAALPGVLLVRPPKASLGTVVGFGFSLGVVQFGLLFLAIALGMPAGLSSLLIQMQVFFTIGLAFVVFGERPGALQMAGGLVAALGVAVIGVWKAQHALLTPLLLVLGAALAWACANIIVKRAGRIDMLALMVWGSLAATPPLLGLSLLVEGPAAIAEGLRRADARTLAAVLFIAYPTTILAFALWNRLLSRYPAATVTPFALLVPVVGISSTSALLGEPFGPVEAGGAALILIGIALSVFGGRRRAAPPGFIPARPRDRRAP
ncbi:EamA family transporter [Methylobacterium oxalidis]|uniref:O-acetylserine/cysteine exporter n=1 Tax=Methylobacterium oxalidis TaxID=944322 RepID=A0A512J519_9HYPH|nr:EamA family transporter [Methylobacterium oxalidis]GEP05058.1 O-acetylserine/cysteine exporter [Methylobacterium oxalidis]GJE33344.1 putative amino-acid metabolite efflux pump [Methylobacterium oxalidis]GLS65663.1 O-acetylserine/cysteine exporter [Methylobacterium oxalidis]